MKKFLPKGKNEMILPDDNNPTIVWDPDKQRWVNTDGDDEEEEKNKAPPPKDSDLMGEFIYIINPTSATVLVIKSKRKVINDYELINLRWSRNGRTAGNVDPGRSPWCRPAHGFK